MSFHEQWSEANPDAVSDGDDLNPPPDGKYTCGLVDGDAFTAQSGKDFVKMVWKVVGGQHNDYQWTVLPGFKSQAQANMTKKQVRDLGIDVDSIDSLEGLGEAIKTKIGGYYELTVKTNGDFRNTYIDGPSAGVQTGFVPKTDVPTDTSDFGPAPVAAAAVADDDIPF